MKAIISHDIDHITVWEHLTKDTILPKYIARMHLELLSGKITFKEFFLRYTDFFKNKWQNIDELITFNNVNKIPNSFFIAVNKGVGLNYSIKNALPWVMQMKLRHCEIGVHGISFENLENINTEYELFKQLTNIPNFGIRMHYVRNNQETLINLAKAGYTYDSTEHGLKDPYKIMNMWEFPFQIMDGWVIQNGTRWQNVNLESAKTATLHKIEEAHKHNIKYLGIDFHDRYFSHSFKTWLNWYMWLVDYLKTNKIEFVNFNTAINELESNKAPLIKTGN